MKRITILILAFLFGSLCSAQNQMKFSANSVKVDLSFLYETLDKSHYDLYANTSKETFDREYKRIADAITDSLTLLQIDRLFHPFIALTKEGHCTMELPFSSYGYYLQNGGTLFPLNIYFDNNKVIILDNFSADSSIKVGDEIVSVNEKSIEVILEDLYRYVHGENNYAKNIVIESLTFPRLFWVINDEYKNFIVEVLRKDKEIKVESPSIPAGEFEAKMAGKKPMSDQTRVFYYIDDIAYLRPGQFYNAPKDGNLQINSDVLDNTEFVHFLDTCFTTIHNKTTQDLIIDLRGNPGGSGTFSNPLAAFFATEPFAGATKFCMRTSEISKNFWKNAADTSQLFIDMKKEILERENGSRFEISGDQYKYHPRKDSLRFDGNTYVLINRFTYSQAIEVSAMIQKYEFGKLIGEQTVPLMSANARQFKLPNTKLTITFPEAYYGDSSMVNGVIPDYLVHDDILTEKDEILDYTIKLINTER